MLICDSWTGPRLDCRLGSNEAPNLHVNHVVKVFNDTFYAYCLLGSEPCGGGATPLGDVIECNDSVRSGAAEGLAAGGGGSRQSMPLIAFRHVVLSGLRRILCIRFYFGVGYGFLSRRGLVRVSKPWLVQHSLQPSATEWKHSDSWSRRDHASDLCNSPTRCCRASERLPLAQPRRHPRGT